MEVNSDNLIMTISRSDWRFSNVGKRECGGEGRMSQAVIIALQDDLRRSSIRPKVRGFFDAHTYSVQYVVSDPATHRCAIIDPVLDFDEKSGSTGTRSGGGHLGCGRGAG